MISCGCLHSRISDLHTPPPVRHFVICRLNQLLVCLVACLLAYDTDAVHLVADHDPDNRVVMGAIQHHQKLIAEHNAPGDLTTVILIQDGSWPRVLMDIARNWPPHARIYLGLSVATLYWFTLGRVAVAFCMIMWSLSDWLACRRRVYPFDGSPADVRFAGRKSHCAATMACCGWRSSRHNPVAFNQSMNPAVPSQSDLLRTHGRRRSQ